MKQITLGDIGRAYWQVLGSGYSEPKFQYYEISTTLLEIKDLLKDESIDEIFAESIKEAFFQKWDKVVFDIEG